MYEVLFHWIVYPLHLRKKKEKANQQAHMQGMLQNNANERC